MEVCEGKDRMMRKAYYNELGATAACVIRGVLGTADIRQAQSGELLSEGIEPKRLFLADSWFGSVKAVSAVAQSGNHACMVIKTGHSRVPKKFLEEKMAHFPGGTWITLEGRAEQEGVDLVCIGYKYNKKKVLIFLCTRGAGSTEEGVPYEAKFPDKFGNVCVRQVARPQILSTYFKYSNAVDLHNQARQYDLALEKKWITQNGYFRLYTTLLGMTVTDTWKLLKKNDPNYISISKFSDILAYDMICHAKEIEKQNEQQQHHNEIILSSSSISLSTVSSVTSASQMKPNKKQTKEMLPGKKN